MRRGRHPLVPPRWPPRPVRPAPAGVAPTVPRQPVVAVLLEALLFQAPEGLLEHTLPDGPALPPDAAYAVTRDAAVARLELTPPVAAALRPLLGPDPAAGWPPAAWDALAALAAAGPLTKADWQQRAGRPIDGWLADWLAAGVVVPAGRSSTLGRPALFAAAPRLADALGGAAQPAKAG